MAKRKKQATLTDQLREIIRASGQTEYRLAKELGCHQSALGRFMSGERGVSAKLLDRLGELLGLEITVKASGKPSPEKKGG